MVQFSAKRKRLKFPTAIKEKKTLAIIVKYVICTIKATTYELGRGGDVAFTAIHVCKKKRIKGI